MNRARRTLLACLASLVLLGAATPAQALFHLYQIDEIYSNADGSVQFVEFLGFSDFQHLLFFGQAQLFSNANTYAFPNNLPNQFTLGASFLVGTPAYAAAPGAVAPDYTIPANFFVPGGDLVEFGDLFNIFESVTLTAGDLPTNGSDSLHIAADGSFTTAPNSPMNFAGETGGIAAPEPSTGLLVATALAWLAVVRRRAKAAY